MKNEACRRTGRSARWTAAAACALVAMPGQAAIAATDEPNAAPATTVVPAPDPSRLAGNGADLAATPKAPDQVKAPPREAYGPPAPKAEKGKLPDIQWSAAPAQVPPALENAIRIVTRDYPSAKAARSSLRAAAADVRTAKWQRFPSLSVDLAYTDKSTSPEPQFVAEVPIWTGGRIEAGIKRAKSGEDVASGRYVQTVQALALTTTQAYFEIARLSQREQRYSESLLEHRRLVETMERRVAQEVSPLADLELARSRSAQIEQEYTIIRAQRQSTLRVLAELISDPAYELGPVPHFDPALDLPNREQLSLDARLHDPQLRRLMAEADVATADVAVSKASLYPRLNGQYSYDDVQGSRVGVVVRLQTSAGFSQFSQIESSQLKRDAANLAIRQAEQQLTRDIESDIIEYDAARARASLSLGASETASRVSESYMRQFIAGRRSWLDVMNALREALSASVGRSDAEVAAMAASVRLLLRSGRWQPEFENGAR